MEGICYLPKNGPQLLQLNFTLCFSLNARTYLVSDIFMNNFGRKKNQIQLNANNKLVLENV